MKDKTKHKIFTKGFRFDEDCVDCGDDKAKSFAFRTGSHRPMNWNFPIKGHFQNVKQIISEDETVLTIVIKIPGVDKSTIKLRAKSDKINLTAEYNKELLEYMHGKDVKMTVTLDKEVKSKEAKVKYVDGILVVTFPIDEDLGEEIPFTSEDE
ncbi:MAG: hypothetical protein INQ03_25185 [Candidatus Heimdallarchaeota archaeon]|nr:hypothetical protein [Candidatus Heimdallarchaeota archaeon]